MRYFAIARNAKGAAIGFIGHADSADAAAALGDKSKAPDYVVVSAEKLSELPGPMLVAIYNSLVPKADAITKFENKERAVARLLAAAETPAPVEAKRGKPRVAKGIVKIGKIPENKIWHKESLRARAFNFLLANDGIEVDDALSKIAHNLGVTRAQARGLLRKIAELGVIKVSE